jgi:hypothetical protein
MKELCFFIWKNALPAHTFASRLLANSSAFAWFILFLPECFLAKAESILCSDDVFAIKHFHTCFAHNPNSPDPTSY